MRARSSQRPFRLPSWRAAHLWVALTLLNATTKNMACMWNIRRSTPSACCQSCAMCFGKPNCALGAPVVVTSGFRNPDPQLYGGRCLGILPPKVHGGRYLHSGVSKSKLIAFMRTQSQVGGLGCYPGRKFIHVDIRGRPNGYKRPVQFKGC